MLRFFLKMCGRDWRAGELNFLLVAVTISIASLSAAAFFSDSVKAGLERDAHEMLAADLVLSSDRPLSPDFVQDARRRGLQTAQLAEFNSMASSSAGEGAISKLVRVKAASNAYPLRGHLRLLGKRGEELVAPAGGPARGTVWVDRILLQGLNLAQNDVLKLGEKRFSVAAVVTYEPDRGIAVGNFLPRLILPLDDLPGTGLAQGGPWITYHLLVAGSHAQMADYEAALKRAIASGQLTGVRLDTIESNLGEWQESLQSVRQFLSLLCAMSALLGALAIAMAARRFMMRHIAFYALLRSLGLRRGQVLAGFGLEFFLLAMAGGLAGVALGYASHFLLLHWLSTLLVEDLPTAGILPAWQGMAASLLLMLGFALPPLLQLRRVPPISVLRGEQTQPDSATWASYVVGLLAFAGLLLWLAQDLMVGLLTAAIFLAGGFGFAVCAWLGLLALRRLRALSGDASWRFAITSLLRRPAASVTQTVALALGLTAMLVLCIVRGDLTTAWRQATPIDAPDHYLVNIQPDQKDGLGARLRRLGPVQFVPILRARLTDVNGKPVDPTSYKDKDARDIVTRDLDLSFADDLPKGNSITSGRWMGESADGEPSGGAPSGGAQQASLDDELAAALRLKVGDILRFDLAGDQLQVRIASLHKFDARSHQINFAFLISPRAAQNLPRTWAAAMRLGADQNAKLNRIAQDYPNITAFDIAPILEQMQTMMDRLARAAQFLFLFTLATGVLVLYAALAGSQDVRMREAALLRALGATQRQLARAQWLEYALLGGLAGLLAAAGATLASWSLAKYAFHLAWHFSAFIWPAGVLAGALCAVAGSWTGLSRILRQPPLASLRAA